MKTIRYVSLCFFHLLFCLSCGLVSDEVDTLPAIQDALTIYVDAYDAETATYTPTALSLNEPIVLRCSGNDRTNINLQFCFAGGVCEVTANDQDIQLSKGQNGDAWKAGDLGDSRVYGYTFEVGHEGYLAAIPLGALTGFYNYGAQPEIKLLREELKNAPNVGRTYTLTVRAKDFDTTLVTAELRFVQLRDAFSDSANGQGDFTVELVSYNYSDVYAMMQ